MGINMKSELQEQLNFLGLENLSESWKDVMDSANKQKKSFHRFLSEIIETEYSHKKEKRRLAMLKTASIPEMWVMETFPFKKQPRLIKKMVMDIYDSMNYMDEAKWLYLVGPTGCGKSGLGSSYLVQAINQGYKGKFISFTVLIEQLYKSIADLSVEKVMKRFAAIDCLLIDELGYQPMNKEQAGLFFELIKMRHKRKCTILTTQLGFKEWETFFQNSHTRNASIDRITENCVVFGMQDCISLRNKHIQYVTSK